MSPSSLGPAPGAADYEAHFRAMRAELHRLKGHISRLTDHLEDLAFPWGSPGHGAECECKECEAWGDLQHARMAVNHPKAPTIENNPYVL